MESPIQTGSCHDIGLKLDVLAEDQTAWSQKTFGPDWKRSGIGALRHLAKEVEETIEACRKGDSEAKQEEFADCFLLLLDAARREGINPYGLICAGQRKMKSNKERTWPEPTDAETPVEHVR